MGALLNNCGFSSDLQKKISHSTFPPIFDLFPLFIYKKHQAGKQGNQDWNIGSTDLLISFIWMYSKLKNKNRITLSYK